MDIDDSLIVNISDDEGNNYNLEIAGEVEYGEDIYKVFLPLDIDESDPDYGYIILREDASGEEIFYDSVDDEETLEKVYALFMEKVFEDEDEEDYEYDSAE